MRNKPPSPDQSPLWPAPVGEVLDGKVVTAQESAGALVKEWIDHCEVTPLTSIIKQVGRRLKAALDDGADYQAVRAGLAAWHRAGYAPTVLDSFINQAMQGTGHAARNGQGAPPPIVTGIMLARKLASGEVVL